MPIFKINNFDQVGISLSSQSRLEKITNKHAVQMPEKISHEAFQELSFAIEPPTLDLEKSLNKWGLYLKSISLYKDFEGFIANLFGALKPNNEIYFTSFAWDYSGKAPFIFPPKGSQGSDYILNMEKDSKRIFIGNGVNLFPSQQVVGALNIVILVYECDQDIVAMGEQLVNIHDQINNSKLTSLIAAISAAPALASGIAIGEAVNELIGVIGNIMKNNKDDFVDLFEGSYGTDKTQQAKIEKYDTSACGIELEFTVSN
jgi:hypothetical protein